MEARELRLGNFLPMEEYLNGLNYCVVTSVSGNKIETICPKNQITGIVYKPKPIPLTEEWLFKFGFEKTAINELFLRAGNVDITYGGEDKKNDVEAYISINSSEGSHSAEPLLHIRFVHQLQNLYFALTGEELKYTP